MATTGTTTAKKAATNAGESAASGSALDRARAASPRERGKTFIADEVVSVIARIAAEQIEGIHSIGEPSLRNIISRMGRHHGVDAEVGMKEAAADIEVVIDFGYPIRDVAQDLREHVIETVEQMTGRRVVEVNIHVVDVFVPKMEQPRSPRRQLE